MLQHGFSCCYVQTQSVRLCGKCKIQKHSSDKKFLEMFFKKRPFLAQQRPSKVQHQWLQNDQLPFLARTRFSAMPQLRVINEEEESLTLFIAFLYIIDLFGIFPFITLPAIFVGLGFFGIPIILVVVTLQVYTSFLLSKCWTMAAVLEPSIIQKRRSPYSAIAELAYGRNVSLLVTILLDVSIFAQYIPNLVDAAENLELIVNRATNGELEFSYCYWVIIVGIFVCPFMWLGSPKNMRLLAIFSVFVLILVVVLLWFCLFTAVPIGKPFEGVLSDMPSWLTIFNGYSVLAFQFDIHSMLLTLQIDMQHKSQVGWAAFCGITTTFTIAIISSFIAAYKFGTMIAANVLETLPRSVTLLVLLVLIALQLCFSAVAGSSALFLQIENQLKISEVFSYKRVVVRSTILALEVLLAEFVPNFTTLMDIVGGTITGPLVFILPPLIFQRISHMNRLHQRISAEATYGTFPMDLNQFPIGSTDSVSPLLQNQRPKSGNNIQLIYRCFTGCFRKFHIDFSFPTAVLMFGCIATIISAYLSLFDLKELFRNNSPCWGNITRDL